MNKFLSVVWYKVLPAVYGGQKGIALFNQFLGERVDLTCLCSQNNETTSLLSYRLNKSLPTSKSQFWNPLVRRRILKEIKSNNYSHVIIEHPYHGWLGKHRKKLGFRFIVHAHNIEFDRMKNRGRWWWKLIRSTEANAFRLADNIAFKLKEDKQFAIETFKLDPRKCLVVPYGTELQEQPKKPQSVQQRIMRTHNIHEHQKIILFTASLDYEPNREAFDAIIKEIVPRLLEKKVSFRVIICGATHGLSFKATPEVILVGEVQNLGEYMAAADVFINPVLTGSGVQTKNIDALSSGLPVVSTKFAAKGLPSYLKTSSLVIAKDGDWDDFATCVVDCLSGDTEIEARFFDEYYWGNIVDRFLDDIAVKR